MCSRSASTVDTTTTQEQEEIEDISALRSIPMDSAFQAGSQQNVISRKYVMQWENSMEGLSNYPENSTWRPLETAATMFQSSTRYQQGACRKSKFRQGDISQAILIGMKIKKVSSNFPCPLALSVTGAKGNYYTCDGNQFAYLIGASEVSNSVDDIIVTSSPYVKSEYLRLYPGMTSQNLRSGIVPVGGEEYVFVDHQHPIVEMMSENQDVLQIDLKNADLIDGRWYKVSKGVTERCLSELENELTDNLPLLDFSKFGATISQLHGKPMNSVSGWGEDCDAATRQRVLSTTRTATVVLEVTYAFA